MANSTVPRSRLSHYSSLLMMALGIITILFVSILVGTILTAVGIAMYLFYRRLQRRSRAAQAAAAGEVPAGSVADSA